LPRRKLQLELTHGSLVTMGGTIQHLYRHGVPRQRSVQRERVNLTFRRLLTIPPT
jgi:alkylated DNA repair dioxygenase AlkB